MKRVGVMFMLLVLMSIGAFAHDAKAVLIDNQPMMSLSAFGDTFDAMIDYNSFRDSIRVSLNYRSVDLVPYSRSAWVDGRLMPLDTPVVIIDGITYVPIRFLCDAFDYDGDWRHCDNQVTIINRQTWTPTVIVVDQTWGRATHQWRYAYDCHDYYGFRVDRNVCNVPSYRNDWWFSLSWNPRDYDSRHDAPRDSWQYDHHDRDNDHWDYSGRHGDNNGPRRPDQYDRHDRNDDDGYDRSNHQKPRDNDRGGKRNDGKQRYDDNDRQQERGNGGRHGDH